MSNASKISRREMLTGVSLAAGSLMLPAAKAISPYAAFQAAPSGPFSYCLNTSTIRGQKVGFMEELKIASKAGYDGIEIWIDSLKAYLDQGGTAKEIRTLLSDLNLRIENAIGFAPWIVDDAGARGKGMEQAKQEMDLLAQVGCRRMAAPPAGATEVAGLDLMRAAERYHALLKLGEQTGVMPQLEVWGFSKNLYQLAQVMFVAVASDHPQARILPDVYHLYKGGSDFHGLQLVSGKAIEVFHMNDYPTNPERADIDDSYRIYPGEGVAPLKQILKTLVQAGEPKVLSLELFNRSYWQQDALKVAKTGLNAMKAAVQQALKN